MSERRESRGAMFVVRSAEGRKSRLKLTISPEKREAQRVEFERAGIRRVPGVWNGDGK